MNLVQFSTLVLLAAIWGGSFLFMRVAVPDFGPIALIGLRVSVAALCFLPILVREFKAADVRPQLPFLLTLGLTNAAIPYTLFAFATSVLAAGFTSILNSTATLFTGVIGFLWLGTRLSASAWIGIGVGVIGVAWLMQDSLNLQRGVQYWGIVAGLAAAALYGFAANLAKSNQHKLSAQFVAGAHLVLAGLCMLPLTIWFWPEQMPSVRSWVAALLLAIVCTGLASLLYFRLLSQLSAHATVSVTFMIPMFGMFWGHLILGELITSNMLIGCVAILLGVGLTTGIVPAWIKRRRGA